MVASMLSNINVASFPSFAVRVAVTAIQSFSVHLLLHSHWVVPHVKKDVIESPTPSLDVIAGKHKYAIVPSVQMLSPPLGALLGMSVGKATPLLKSALVGTLVGTSEKGFSTEVGEGTGELVVGGASKDGAETGELLLGEDSGELLLG